MNFTGNFSRALSNSTTGCRQNRALLFIVGTETFVACLAVVFSLLFLTTVARTKRLQSLPVKLIAAFAAANLLQLTIVLPTNIVGVFHHFIGCSPVSWLSKVIDLLISLFSMTSMETLAIMAYEQHTAIRKPFLHETAVNTRFLFTILTLLWLITVPIVLLVFFAAPTMWHVYIAGEIAVITTAMIGVLYAHITGLRFLRLTGRRLASKNIVEAKTTKQRETAPMTELYFSLAFILSYSPIAANHIHKYVWKSESAVVIEFARMIYFFNPLWACIAYYWGMKEVRMATTHLLNSAGTDATADKQTRTLMKRKPIETDV